MITLFDRDSKPFSVRTKQVIFILQPSVTNTIEGAGLSHDPWFSSAGPNVDREASRE